MIQYCDTTTCTSRCKKEQTEMERGMIKVLLSVTMCTHLEYTIQSVSFFS